MPDRSSHLISTVLAPAVRLWLRSQVQSAAHLEAEIQGSDRQILQGYIPKVRVTARQVVYQGLHLSSLDLHADQIRINLGQVLRGKPLRLLAIVPVEGSVQISQADLAASHQSPLLVQALRDLVALWLPQLARDYQTLPEGVEQTAFTSALIACPTVTLQQGGLLLSGELQGDRLAPLECHIVTQLRQIGPATLEFYDTFWFNRAESERFALEPVEVNLGDQVTIAQLQLTAEALHSQGKINVIPVSEPAAE